jgi:quercetin dioxygenase-like cupin family protein
MKSFLVPTLAALAVGASFAVRAQAPAITRTTLQQVDLSIPGREVVTVRAEFPAGGTSGRHTHPGDEVTYVIDGTLSLEVEGAPTRTVKAGEAFMVPAGKIHNATAQGGKVVAVANYLIEKGKPVTTPAK